MDTWIDAFKEAFPQVPLAPGGAPSSTAVFRLQPGAAEHIPPWEIQPASPSVVPEMLRWMTRNGVRWCTSLQAAVEGPCDVYLSGARLPRREPRLQPKSHLVTAETGMALGDLERWLNLYDLTLGPIEASACDVTLHQAISGEAYVEHCLGGEALRDRVAAIGGILGTGFPFRTRAVPRAATGPDFKYLFFGNHTVRGLMLDVTLRAMPRRLGSPDLWRWLRVTSPAAAADLLRRLAQDDYPWLALHAFATGNDLWEVRMAYNRNHPLAAPMTAMWEESSELALQSGPLSATGGEVALPATEGPWQIWAVTHASARKLLQRVPDDVRIHLFKPQHDHVLVRLGCAGGDDAAADRRLEDLCNNLSARRLYPHVPVGEALGDTREVTWLHDLNI